MDEKRRLARERIDELCAEISCLLEDAGFIDVKVSCIEDDNHVTIAEKIKLEEVFPWLATGWN